MKTADHFSFHPASGLVRVNVQESVTTADGERVLPGVDVDVKLDDLPSEVRSAVLVAADRMTSFLNLPPAARPAAKPSKKKK
jgi:hypothetical protein